MRFPRFRVRTLMIAVVFVGVTLALAIEAARLIRIANEQAKADVLRRRALRIAKFRHAGDWNVAPMAIPNLATSLRDRFNLNIVIGHEELPPRDPSLAQYPVVYMHGRAGFQLAGEDLEWLRGYLDPGGGTLFADAAFGSPAFDAAFRKAVAEMLPKNPLVPIPRDDALYSRENGYDLSDVQYTEGAGGGRDFPQLEGVKIDGHWAVIYSKYDIGCALGRQQGADCKGYTHESALRIATNIVIDSILP